MFQPCNDYGYLRHEARCGIDLRPAVLDGVFAIGSPDGIARP